jgi:hypothetical protein
MALSKRDLRIGAKQDRVELPVVPVPALRHECGALDDPIARQILAALLEQGIKILYVTHMYELAHGFWLKGMTMSLFLRAERLPDGRRTFRMEEGEPQETSYGEDL